MKVIIVSTPKGQYLIPLKNVAEHRADYYACEVDGFERESIDWQNEVDLVMKDDFEGIDWFLNNTNWEDWSSVAVKINEKIKVTDDDFWRFSDDFEIKEIESEESKFEEFVVSEEEEIKDPIYDEFDRWFEEKQRSFHCSQFDEKEIAYSAWLAGRNSNK